MDLSILSVIVDPGLNNNSPYIGSNGVGDIGIRAGLGNQQVLSEGVCFDSNASCYSTASPVGAQAFDHFGTFTVGDVTLTISSTSPQTATPEPEFEAGAGLMVLLAAIGLARRAGVRALKAVC